MAGKYSEIFSKATTDPKYAEYQRREFAKKVKTELQNVTQIKNNIANLKKDVKKNSTDIQTLSKRLVQLDANNDGTVDSPANASEFTTKTAQLKTATAKRNLLKKDLVNAENNLTRVTRNLSSQKLTLAKLDEITGVTSKVLLEEAGGGSGGKGDDRSNSANQSQITTYLYNAPMVKSAYFSSNSLQANTTRSTGTKTLPPTMTNALVDAFKNNGTRGVIQMNADTATYLKQRINKIKGKRWDPNAYGFRFHYNPTSVEMQYGQMMDVAPELMMEETQKFNPITPLNVGAISFTLYLNRIEDMKYVRSDGTLRNPLNDNKIATTDVYPEEVSTADLKQIYRKGTMYDLEYLFRAVHSGSNDYNSLLRGKTSDIGWLVGVAVELHLGAGLRYLVRINGVSVNHAMFNERMVPTLTTVNISASRFYDTPGVLTKATPSGGGGGGRGTAVAE